MIGYDEPSRAYRIWVADRQKIVVSRDVIFNEKKRAAPMSEDSYQIDSDCDDHLWESEEEHASVDAAVFEREILPISIPPLSSIPAADVDVDETQTQQADEGTEDVVSDLSAPVPDLPVNIHLRRSGRIAPMSLKSMEGWQNRLNSSCSICFHTAPIKLSQALQDKHWRAAIDKELKGLVDLQSYVEVKELPTMKVLRTQIILSEKADKTKKARVVAFGNDQVLGVDFTETWAPTISSKSLRLICALATRFGVSPKHLDVQQAFLNATLHDLIYV
jgi:hypothetical protein